MRQIDHSCPGFFALVLPCIQTYEPTQAPHAALYGADLLSGKLSKDGQFAYLVLLAGLA